ncbi:MAG: winged helix-turn-helix transcriptional regulator [Pseudomonadota bacterium]
MNFSTEHEPLEGLIALAHHRWNIPVIAELERQSGAKFVSLANRLGVSRGSLTASLSDLIDLGLVQRNSGHGHPLRPEYLLTEQGQRIGQHCNKISRLVAKRREEKLAYSKWTLPLVAAIGNGASRFNEVRDSLPVATPRAIALGLKSLTHYQWADRSIIDDYPPAAGYILLPKGERIWSSVNELI